MRVAARALRHLPGHDRGRHGARRGRGRPRAVLRHRRPAPLLHAVVAGLDVRRGGQHVLQAHPGRR